LLSGIRVVSGIVMLSLNPRLAQQIMGQFTDWRVLTTADMWQTSQNSGRVSTVGVGIYLEVAMLLESPHAFQDTRCNPKFSQHAAWGANQICSCALYTAE
jgi:hypothetical protein